MTVLQQFTQRWPTSSTLVLVLLWSADSLLASLGLVVPGGSLVEEMAVPVVRLVDTPSDPIPKNVSLRDQQGFFFKSQAVSTAESRISKVSPELEKWVQKYFFTTRIKRNFRNNRRYGDSFTRFSGVFLRPIWLLKKAIIWSVSTKMLCEKGQKHYHKYV